MMQIYKVINKISGKWYIGKDMSDRPYYYGSGKALKNAIAKYGKESFEKSILETCESKEHLIEREKHWISMTDAVTDKMSYNIAAGGEGGDLSEHIDYEKRGYKGDRFVAAQEKIRSMSDDDRKDFYARQGASRSKIWFVSRIETPHIEIEVTNVHQWSLEHGCEGLSKTANRNHRLYGKSCQGWRCRSAKDLDYPTYVNNRKIGHPNIACKGKSWKLEDGKRVWYKK